MFVYVLLFAGTYVRIFVYVLACIFIYLHIFPQSVDGKGLECEKRRVGEGEGEMDCCNQNFFFFETLW